MEGTSLGLLVNTNLLRDARRPHVIYQACAGSRDYELYPSLGKFKLSSPELGVVFFVSVTC